PPHPGPRWAAQLDAMDRESEQRSGVRFAGLSPEQRRAIVEDAIRSERSASLPRSPALADGVAAGLLAWFYATSRANDLCYQAEVGRHLCRGTASLPEEPAPLGDE
ncbi:MAG: gluconate 2-dehydrogenase subunit 3 family protein, partial [Gemmatimonadota bacterium]|nr:gluconate 2-dehydrogenase subunit 3 family protein [Gemmatimonadota bacterium]